MKLLLLLLSFSFVFTPYLALGEEVVKIGVFAPLTGKFAREAGEELNGLRLGHSEFNEVLGKKVVLIVADNKSSQESCMTAVKRLIEKNKVVALLGVFSSDLVRIGAEIAEKEKIPLVYTSTGVKTEGKKYCFRACFTDKRQGQVIANYLKKVCHCSRVALISQKKNEYSVGLAASFERAFEQLGGQIVAKESFLEGEQNFTKQIQAIAKSNPDAVFLPCYLKEGLPLLKTARRAGMDCLFFGGDAMDIRGACKEIDPAIFNKFSHTTVPYDATMPAMTEAIRSFTEYYNEAVSEEANSRVALGYTAYYILYSAINACKSKSPDAIIKALEKIKYLDTPLGYISLNREHNTEMPISIISYKDGKRIYEEQ